VTDLLPTGGEFRGQMAYAVLLVWMLRKLTGIGIISRESKRLLQIVGMVGAFLASFGVHFAFQGTMACGGQATMSFPGLGELIHNALNFITTLGVQEGGYNIARIPELVREAAARSSGSIASVSMASPAVPPLVAVAQGRVDDSGSV